MQQHTATQGLFHSLQLPSPVALPYIHFLENPSAAFEHILMAFAAEPRYCSSSGNFSRKMCSCGSHLKEHIATQGLF